MTSTKTLHKIEKGLNTLTEILPIVVGLLGLPFAFEGEALVKRFLPRKVWLPKEYRSTYVLDREK